MWMERTGIKVDKDYMLKARRKVVEYRDQLQDRFKELIAEYDFTHTQGKRIIEYFKEVWDIHMETADELSLTRVAESINNAQVKEIVELILELRNVENKVLSTYIDGKLKEIVIGRIYPTVNNQGAVSGRMSSSMQQQPKDPLVNKYTGEELFHPRKIFIADDDCVLLFMDYNQMELRVQAEYTILLKKPDVNLCSAYIPLGYVAEDGHAYRLDKDKGKPKEMKYYAPDGTPWTPTDLHAVTTFKAFPHLNNDPTHPEFKSLRRLGKVCNFLKNYQGGVAAIKDQLGVSDEIAEKLDKAYYEAFPNIKEYQRWVQKEMLYNNFVTNLMGRRYYMNDSRWFYKAGNYLVQGTAADLFKSKLIELDDALLPTDTRLALPIHDEIMINMPIREMYLIPVLQYIMEDVDHVIKYIPMDVGVDISYTNWADKEEYI